MSARAHALAFWKRAVVADLESFVRAARQPVAHREPSSTAFCVARSSFDPIPRFRAGSPSGWRFVEVDTLSRG